MIIIALSEPNASDVEKEGYGYIVASVGELGGNAPYTAYNARKSYIENNPKIIEGFTKAINKALEYVRNTDSEIIAKSIYDFFPVKINKLKKKYEKFMQGKDAKSLEKDIKDKIHGMKRLN